MRPPRNFDELKTQISRRQNSLPGRLRQIAEFATQRPNEMAFGTAATIAEAAGVQPSSLVRFAHSFGFEGFSALQQVFRARLVTGAVPGYRERIAGMRAEIAGGGQADGNPAAVLARFAADGMAALEHLHASIKPADLKRAVRAMADAEQIYVMAQGRSFPVAFYLHYALCRLDLRSQLIDGVGGIERLQVRAARRSDVLIAISFKDYSPDVVRMVEEMAGRGLGAIAITDSPLSPLAAKADIVFETHEDQTQSFRSLVAPMCLAQSLVVALGHHVTSDARAAE